MYDLLSVRSIRVVNLFSFASLNVAYLLHLFYSFIPMHSPLVRRRCLLGLFKLCDSNCSLEMRLTKARSEREKSTKFKEKQTPSNFLLGCGLLSSLLLFIFEMKEYGRAPLSLLTDLGRFAVVSVLSFSLHFGHRLSVGSPFPASHSAGVASSYASCFVRRSIEPKAANVRS